MKIYYQVLASLLLLFNGAGALYGGYNLVNCPDGSSLGLPLTLLWHSPFPNYLIPGYILFFSNGLLSFCVLTGLLMKVPYYPWFIIAQGAILLVWLVVQIIMIRSFSVLQPVLAAVALLLIIMGWLLMRFNR